MRRYRVVAAIMTFLAVVVVLKAGYIMTVQKTYWQTVAAKVRLDSVLVNPLRGNILAAGNQPLACNLPEYRVYMDFQAIRDSKCDTLWHDSLGRPTKDLLALCEGLHRVFPSRSAKAFLDSLEAAYAYIDSKGRRIDVFVQDLAERSLKKELIKDKAYTGVAIVMEVETGDIKAMVNLDKDSLGRYYEGRNHAIADLLEPGSVFKTASILTAIDDGYIKDTANCIVHTGSGIMEMHGAKMRDHNWHRGGYGDINVSRILQVSSNIGVSWLIDKFYGDNPGKFVDGIHRLGLATDLKLPFPEYEAPRVRHPRKDKTGRHWANWSKTALPWMSIGYETQVPPISTLTFYNAIANGGKMVRPRFVSRIEKDGEVIKEFPVQVIKNQICKNPASIGVIQDILYKVVHVGLGKTAGSKSFHVSGKTGTAQKAHNGSYKSGIVDYLLSFCGYFPSGKDADGNPVKPKYSCIVCIQKSGLPASGGLMSGQVFHDIAEGIMARNVRYDVSSSRDSLSCFVPEVKSGNILAADYVLSHLGLKTTTEWSGSYATGNPIWGTAEKETKEVKLSKVPMTPEGIMPDVMGMGARDAVYLLESRGLKVIIKGRGKVQQQSIAYGKPYRRGARVTLEME